MNDFEELEEREVTLNFSCKICGEKDFDLREGFYYCKECGTQQDEVQAVHVERVDHNGEAIIPVKKIKIQHNKNKDLDLTSWECYNYILRGIVEELVGIGAKDDLKLMTLQLWTACLRKNEVAFFNKKHADLPKLNVGFKKRDAKALYNHCIEKRRRRRKSKSDSVVASDDFSRRAFRKSKRQLDESVYSLHSSTVNAATSESGFSASTSLATNKPIQLKFSSHARKHFKKIMHPNHLKKHEMDALGTLECRSEHLSAKKLSKSQKLQKTINMRQLYALIGIALNLTEDDIQLSDLIRFISEGHVSTKNVLRYFPENLHKDLNEILSEISFNCNNEKYTDKVVRDQIARSAKFIQIRSFKMPNLLGLIQRYVKELCLPQCVYLYAERLYNLIPPTMKTRAPHIYPNYEARAMAYIIFILKLFFGLDGYKETSISESSKNINKKLSAIADEYSTSENSKYPNLFVWSEWVEYIEMRKIILSQYSRAFSEQFKQCQTVENFIKCIAIEQKLLKEAENMYNEKKQAQKVENMQRMFDDVHTTLGSDATKMYVGNISFEPSLTPATNNFKKVLLYCSMNERDCFPIPEFMKVDHSQRTLEPHLDTRPLAEFLKKGDVELDVEFATCTSNRNYVGFFWSIDEPDRNLKFSRANFDVNPDVWSRKLRNICFAEPLFFKTSLVPIQKSCKRKKPKLKAYKRPTKKNTNSVEKSNEEHCSAQETADSTANDIRSAHSINIFREDNMNVLQNVKIDAPIRNMNSVNILGDAIEDDKLNICENDENAKKFNGSDNLKDGVETYSKRITLVTSKMDHWLLLGITSKILDYQKKTIQQRLPRSFLWLVETCAQTVQQDWFVLYENLLAIEVMFSLGLENLDSFTDCLRLQYNFSEREIKNLTNSFREIW